MLERIIQFSIIPCAFLAPSWIILSGRNFSTLKKNFLFQTVYINFEEVCRNHSRILWINSTEILRYFSHWRFWFSLLSFASFRWYKVGSSPIRQIIPALPYKTQQLFSHLTSPYASYSSSSYVLNCFINFTSKIEWFQMSIKNGFRHIRMSAESEWSNTLFKPFWITPILPSKVRHFHDIAFFYSHQLRISLNICCSTLVLSCCLYNHTWC